MVSVPVALWLVRLTGAYLGIGLGFAVLFAFGLVDRMDPVAAHGTRPFRFLLLPGATLLWPLLVRRLIRGDTAPPIERTAHRRSIL
jgi:hypothetical protein